MESLADKYISYYLSASKARGDLSEKLSLFDRYWEGNVNEAESENDPASSTNIIHSNIEGQVANLMEQNISATAEAISGDVEHQKSVDAVLNFILKRNRMIRKIDIHERRREKYGTGILRVTFNPSALCGAGLPEIECVSNRAMYIDPCISDPYKINDARFIIEKIKKSIYWASEQYGSEVAEKIKPNFDPALDGDESFEGDGENDWYCHLLVWTREGGHLRLVEMTGCGIILSDSGEDFYRAGRYPYFFTPLYFREQSIWGKGDVELLIPVQDIINDLDDQIRINARLTGNPQRLIETGSGIDLDALTNEAGLNIPVNHIGAVKNLEAPQLPPYIESRRNAALQYECQKVTRFSDQMMGGRQQGVKTATEAIAITQAGNTGMMHKKLLLQETLSEVMEYALNLAAEFWTREMTFRVSGEESIKVNPSHIDCKCFDVSVTVGAGLPKNRAMLYSIISELYRSGLISAEEAREYICTELSLPFEKKGIEIENFKEETV